MHFAGRQVEQREYYNQVLLRLAACRDTQAFPAGWMIWI